MFAHDRYSRTRGHRMIAKAAVFLSVIIECLTSAYCLSWALYIISGDPHFPRMMLWPLIAISALYGITLPLWLRAALVPRRFPSYMRALVYLKLALFAVIFLFTFAISTVFPIDVSDLLRIDVLIAILAGPLLIVVFTIPDVADAAPPTVLGRVDSASLLAIRWVSAPFRYRLFRFYSFTVIAGFLTACVLTLMLWEPDLHRSLYVIPNDYDSTTDHDSRSAIVHALYSSHTASSDEKYQRPHSDIDFFALIDSDLSATEALMKLGESRAIECPYIIFSMSAHDSASLMGLEMAVTTSVQQHAISLERASPGYERSFPFRFLTVTSFSESSYGHLVNSAPILILMSLVWAAVLSIAVMVPSAIVRKLISARSRVSRCD